MNMLKIPKAQLSDGVWIRILERSSYRQSVVLAALQQRLQPLENLRQEADYNTGSISLCTAWLLNASVWFFQASTIVEVGTFIGRSAIAMGLALQELGGGELHTCDKSNDIILPQVTGWRCVQYPRKTSLEMFKELLPKRREQVDFVHLDGLLTEDDFPLLTALLKPTAIVALDDFIGVEKGVRNSAALLASGFGQTHVLIAPPSSEVLSLFGLTGTTVTALLVNRSRIGI